MDILCSIWCFIKNFFTLSEGQSWLTNFWVPVITGGITIYFAGRSFYLDRKIRRLSNFHGKPYVNVMNTYMAGGFEGKIVRFMFNNHSNVKGFIDEIYAKAEPISKRKKIENLFKEKTIYKHLLVPIRDRSCIIGTQGLPMELGGNESKAIYVDYNWHLDGLNDALAKGDLILKGYIFVDSIGNKYEYKIKKGFNEFIRTKKQLSEFKNNQ